MRPGSSPGALIYAIISGATWTVVWLILAWISGDIQQAVIGIFVGIVIFAFTYFIQKLMQKFLICTAVCGEAEYSGGSVPPFSKTSTCRDDSPTVAMTK